MKKLLFGLFVMIVWLPSVRAASVGFGDFLTNYFTTAGMKVGLRTNLNFTNVTINTLYVSNFTFNTFTVPGNGTNSTTYIFPLTNFISGQLITVITNGNLVYFEGTNLPVSTVVYDTIEELVATPIPLPGIGLLAYVRDPLRGGPLAFYPQSVDATNRFDTYASLDGPGNWKRPPDPNVYAQHGTVTGFAVTNDTLVAALVLQSARATGKVVYSGTDEFLETDDVPLLDNNVLYFEDGAQATGLWLTSNDKTNQNLLGVNVSAAVADLTKPWLSLTNCSIVRVQVASSRGYTAAPVHLSGNSDTVFFDSLNRMGTPHAFGALANGVADDTIACQLAITATAPSRPVYFPAGHYVITNTLSAARMYLRGDGRENTVIVWAGADNGTNSVIAITNGADGSGIKGMSVYGAYKSSGIFMGTSSDARMDDLWVLSAKDYGIYLYYSIASTLTNFRITQCATNCVAIAIDFGSGQHIHDGKIDQIPGTALKIVQASNGLKLSGMVIESIDTLLEIPAIDQTVLLFENNQIEFCNTWFRFGESGTGGALRQLTLLGNAFALGTDTQQTINLFGTNAPVDGDIWTLNGQVRTWKNTVTDATTQILRDADLATSISNLFDQVTANPYPGSIELGRVNSTYLTFTAPVNTAITAVVLTNWGWFSTSAVSVDLHPMLISNVFGLKASGNYFGPHVQFSPAVTNLYLENNRFLYASYTNSAVEYFDNQNPSILALGQQAKVTFNGLTAIENDTTAGNIKLTTNIYTPGRLGVGDTPSATWRAKFGSSAGGNAIAVHGGAGADQAPAFSLYRSGIREGVFGIEPDGYLTIFNGGGSAVYTDATFSANRQITLAPGGQVSIGSGVTNGLFNVGTAGQFSVGGDGDLERIKGVLYDFPSALGAAGSVLTDAGGNGVLSWASGGGGGITGSGTANTVMKWTAGTVAGDSGIGDTGSVATFASPITAPSITLTNGGSITGTAKLIFGGDESIRSGGSAIILEADGADRLTLGTVAFSPSSLTTYSLGTSALPFTFGHIDASLYVYGLLSGQSDYQRLEVFSSATNVFDIKPEAVGAVSGNISLNLQSLGTGTVQRNGVAIVGGPASATDNAVARYDGTTGNLIQNSGVTIGDSGELTATSYVSGAYLFISAFSTYITAAANGVLLFRDASAADWNRFSLGGTTAAYPSIKRSGAGITFRLADDSTNAAITALSGYFDADCSALTFTDRSKAPKLADAYKIVASVQEKDGHVDHSKLDPLAWGTKRLEIPTGKMLTNIVDLAERGKSTNVVAEVRVEIKPDQTKRDLGMVISAQAMVINDLLARVKALESR